MTFCSEMSFLVIIIGLVQVILIIFSNEIELYWYIRLYFYLPDPLFCVHSCVSVYNSVLCNIYLHFLKLWLPIGSAICEYC